MDYVIDESEICKHLVTNVNATESFGAKSRGGSAATRRQFSRKLSVPDCTILLASNSLMIFRQPALTLTAKGVIAVSMILLPGAERGSGRRQGDHNGNFGDRSGEVHHVGPDHHNRRLPGTSCEP